MKIKQRLKRTKLNNQGVSLMELLIAITILSIISGILFRGMILSARTNSKAKIQHKATSLAQNVMEGLKAESINEIMSMFCYPEVSSTDDEGNIVMVKHFDILPESFFEKDINLSVGPLGNVYGIEEENLNKPGRVYDDTVNTYWFYLDDVKMEDTLFDVSIELKAAPYKEKSIEFNGQKHNNGSALLVPAIDSNTDAVISFCDKYDEEAAAEAQNKYGAYYDPQKLRRMITIDVKTVDMLIGDDAIEVFVTFTYNYANELDPIYEEKDVPVYSNIENTGREFRNIFLFYPPAYKWLESNCTDSEKDQIVINNLENVPFDLYLIKQQLSIAPAEMAFYANYENYYKMRVMVNESSMVSPIEPKVAIHTNLDTNIYETAMTGSDQAEYYYNGATALSKLKSSPDEKSDAEKAFELNSITNDKEIDRVMDVIVKVYQAGEGTFTNKDEFESQAGECRAEIEGSIRN